MELKNKWNFSSLIMIMAVLIAGFTSIKVAISSHFWMDDMVAQLFLRVPDVVIPFFLQLTEMGDKKVLGIVVLLTLAWLLLRKSNYVGAAALALSVSIGNEASKLLKNLFERPRPDLEHLVHVTSYSFPSGHSMVGMIVYFMIAYLLIEGTKPEIGKIIIGAFAAVLLLLIGASRIILHVHYPSDVLGGFAFGFIWVSIWILVYNYFKRRIE
jgi:membrane-associated phospholipid phosphatase